MGEGEGGKRMGERGKGRGKGMREREGGRGKGEGRRGRQEGKEGKGEGRWKRGGTSWEMSRRRELREVDDRTYSYHGVAINTRSYSKVTPQDVLLIMS